MKIKSKDLLFSSLPSAKQMKKLMKAQSGKQLGETGRSPFDLDTMQSDYFDNLTKIMPTKVQDPVQINPPDTSRIKLPPVPTTVPGLKQPSPPQARGKGYNIGEAVMFGAAAFDAVLPDWYPKQQVVQPQMGYNPNLYGTGSQAIADYGAQIMAAGGGLSRSEDYGSSKKPYPGVKSGDFAGGGRSYPIPTRADAVDALRLAGLHGRGDVKAKVYSKYPDLRQADGGYYILGQDDNNSLSAQAGGQATRQDSLDVYNRAKQVEAYYNRRGMYEQDISTRYLDPKTSNLLDHVEDASRKYDPVADRRWVDTKGAVHVKPLSKKYYRQDIDANKFNQREIAEGILDTRAPMQLYDRRIKPTLAAGYLNIDPNDPLVHDNVMIAGYDPIGVKPYDMLTPEEKKLRIQRYGTLDEQIQLLMDEKHPKKSGSSKSSSTIPSRPTPKFPEHRESRVQGADITGDINVQGTGIRPADLSQKPTKYSVTVRDENAPGKQRSIYFKDKKTWKNFMDSGAISMISSEERDGGATAAGYRTMESGGWIQNAINPAHKGYSIGETYDVSDEEINTLKSMGYKFDTL